MHVDDFQITGDYKNKEFRAEYEHLKKLYRWGTWKPDVEGYSVCGVEVSRNPDMGFRLSQEKYAKTVQPINVKRHRKSDPDSKLTADEITACRAILGQAQWLSTQNYAADRSARVHATGSGQQRDGQGPR